ncbi:MAG: hypothetical protein H7210_01095 [Pyrinomonadaceae bacterium]|nr:hypothetical protein [Phycisphaerales bacterium]
MMYAKPFDLPLIDPSEYDDRINEQEKNQSSLQHLRDSVYGQRIPSLDQNGQGYCWAYSSTSAMMLARAFAGLPYVRLSAHKVACLEKNYRDEGGWNAVSIEHIAEKGVPSVQFWPEKSMSRANDTPEMRANSLLHMNVEWMDLAEGGEELKKQMATCLLSNIPYASDHNWWSHSICACRLIKWNPLTVRIWNSWGEWSDNGMGDLVGSKAIPQGAIAVRVVTPSVT